MELVNHIRRVNSLQVDYDTVEEYDVIIIGAGLSGLSAAYKLFKEQPTLKIRILEAKDRIGGRILSTELPARNSTTDVWDMGGSFIGSIDLQPSINALLAELGINTYPQNFVGKKLLQTGKSYNISEYDFLVPDIGLVSLIDTTRLIKHLHNVEKKVSAPGSSFDKSITNLDSTTAEILIQSKTWTNCTLDCARAAIRANFGSELNKLSALYLIAYGQSCKGIFNAIESGESSAHAFKISGGAQRLCSRILEIIGREKLQLETIVTNIEKKYNYRDQPYSLIKTMNGSVFHTKYVVLAIPPNLIPNIQFEPNLSPTKYEFFSSLAPAHTIKVIITYDTAFWINEGFSGEVVTNGGKSETEGCTTGPLCVVFDATTYNKSPALMCIIGGQQALDYESKTNFERKEAVIKSLISLFKTNLVRDYIVYSEKIWRHEPFNGACPQCLVPPGVARLLNNALREPENRIFFAVSELSESWMSYMEGAVQSGEKAATQILNEF